MYWSVGGGGDKSENRETSKEAMEVVQLGDDGVLDLIVGVQRDTRCILEVERRSADRLAVREEGRER